MSEMMVRIQEKGQVTIPSRLRKKMNLKKGDLVIFEETEAGVLIKPADVLLSDALSDIGRALEEKGIRLDEVMERGRQIREGLVKEKYDIEESKDE